MYLLEIGGSKRTKVATAAAATVKSSLCFDIICLSRIPSASTQQQLPQLGAAFVQLYADMLTDTLHISKDTEKELVVSKELFSPFMLRTWIAQYSLCVVIQVVYGLLGSDDRILTHPGS